jgi:hypothetical protein
MVSLRGISEQPIMMRALQADVLVGEPGEVATR